MDPSNPPPIVEHAYHCSNRNCRDYHVEVTTDLGPRDYRRATGHPMCCATCGAIMVWKGAYK